MILHTLPTTKTLPPEGTRGGTLIGVLVSATLLLAVLTITFVALKYSSQDLAHGRQRVVAQALATELLENFRSMNNDQLIGYLRRNPSAAPYTLCAQINQLNRTTGLIALPDPIADVMKTSLGAGQLIDLNRSFRVEVLNRVTLQVNGVACTQTPSTFTRSADESLVATVTVSWKESKEDPASKAKEISVSAMLTD